MFCNASRISLSTDISSSTIRARFVSLPAIPKACARIRRGSSFTSTGRQNSSSMNSPEIQLAAALRERLALIADTNSRCEPEAHLAKLQDVSEKIAALEKELPPSADPQLRHFLARCSYDKALAFLEQT